MTRDEAIECLWIPNPPQSWALGKGDAADLVDQLLALGVLKLSEPVYHPDAIVALNELTKAGRVLTVISVLDGLTKAGFELVKKRRAAP